MASSSDPSQASVGALTSFLLVEVGPSGERRFDSRSAIVEAIMQVANMTHPSAVSAVSKLLNRGLASRPVWDALVQALSDRTEARYREVEIARLRTLLEGLNRSMQSEAEALLEEFFGSEQSAEELFAARPAWPPTAGLASHRSYETLLTKLGLTANSAESTAAYTLVVSSPSHAARAWQELVCASCGLFFPVDTAIHPEESIVRTKALVNTGQLRIAAVHPSLCSLPLNIHDPSNPLLARAYMAFIEETKGLRPVRLPRLYVQQWLESVYADLQNLPDYRPLEWSQRDEESLLAECRRRMSVKLTSDSKPTPSRRGRKA